MFINSSNRYSVSFGPGHASGWNCTVYISLFLYFNPSTVLSFKFICDISAISGFMLFSSIAYPWFCEVIYTLSFFKSFTGWFGPRWPYLNLYVYSSTENLVKIISENEYLFMLEKYPASITFREVLKLNKGTF